MTAESVKFTIKDTADVQKVEMKDDVTKVKISKQDIAGKELPGAKLTILDQDGKVVESWTSTEKAHYIEMLPIGKYTLREETAPDGYLVAKDVEFKVKDGLNYQKTGKELMSRDELAVMDGEKCILQLRGVRPFLSNKYDITKHKRYKELADYDKKNAFDVEKYLNHNLTFSKDTEFEMFRIDVTEDEIRQIEIIN